MSLFRLHYFITRIKRPSVVPWTESKIRRARSVDFLSRWPSWSATVLQAPKCNWFISASAFFEMWQIIISFALSCIVSWNGFLTDALDQSNLGLQPFSQSESEFRKPAIIKFESFFNLRSIVNSKTNSHYLFISRQCLQKIY